MKKFKIYVVEDMAISRAALISLLEDADYEVVGSAANANKAWDDLQFIDVDLALLDINLAGKQDGIWLAEKIRTSLKMAIVFLTAYGDEETISRLSSLNPNGYLMKPYNQPTLITTINIALKAYQNLTKKELVDFSPTLSVIIEESGQKIKLFLNDINYILSDGNYLEIHLENKMHIIRSKLKDFIKSLPENNFILQTHLRYVVNLKKVTVLNSNNLNINQIVISISKSYKNQIAKFFE